MGCRELKERFMAVPWIYDNLRPLVVGGIDQKALARFCKVDETDRVLDLGCGTAKLVEHLRCKAYLGVDLDSSALDRARRHESRGIRFVEGDAWDEACRELGPTVVLMIGVVHHLSDEAFQSIARRLKRATLNAPRIVTLDVSYFRGHFVNNLLSSLDRGRNVRKPADYEKLFTENGLLISGRELVFTRLRYVQYIGYHLAFRDGP